MAFKLLTLVDHYNLFLAISYKNGEGEIKTVLAISIARSLPERVAIAASTLLYDCGVFFLVVSCHSIPQGAVTGLSTSIPCDLGRQEEAPFWFINGTVYELFSISRHFPSIPVVNSYTSLLIPNVTRALHNTAFRCATFDRSGNLSSGDAIELMVAGVFKSRIIVPFCHV